MIDESNYEKIISDKQFTKSQAVDALFKNWTGTSPVTGNIIGYWTVKSWLSIPKESTKEDDIIRREFANSLFSKFMKKEKDLAGSIKNKERSRILRYKKAVNQLMAIKNWGLPKKAFREIGIIINAEDLTEDQLLQLSQKVKEAMDTPTHKRKFFNYFITSSIVGGSKKFASDLKSFVKGKAKKLDKMKSFQYGTFKEQELYNLYMSTPELRQHKKINFVRAMMEKITVPAISYFLLNLGWTGILAYCSKIIEAIPGLPSNLFEGKGEWTLYLAAFLLSIFLTGRVYKYIVSRYIKNKADLKREQNPLFDHRASEIYAGFATPESLAKEYKARLDEIQRNKDLSPKERRTEILNLYSEYQTNIRPSIDKGVYLLGEQEGAQKTEYLKRGSEGLGQLPFLIELKQTAIIAKFEEEIPVILQEYSSEIVADFRRVLEGTGKMLPNSILKEMRENTAQA